MSNKVRVSQRPEDTTWADIRVAMQHAYGGWYKETELRQMEVKWKRIFAECGWSMKEKPLTKEQAWRRRANHRET